jgi:hypothetical protein
MNDTRLTDFYYNNNNNNNNNKADHSGREI